jgi:hypothetical protein
VNFDPEGHIDLTPTGFLELANRDPRRLVNDYLLGGTPHVFRTYEAYCRFREALGSALHVHPCTVTIRGSCLLGYSVAPKVNKAWVGMDAYGKTSDLDVAVVDLGYFEGLETETRNWEARQLHQGGADLSPKDQRRRDLRRHNCVDDSCLPPATCVPHVDAVKRLDTANYCDGKSRWVGTFVFRDWWSLRNRWEWDIGKLCVAVQKGDIAPPV